MAKKQQRMRANDLKNKENLISVIFNGGVRWINVLDRILCFSVYCIYLLSSLKYKFYHELSVFDKKL